MQWNPGGWFGGQIGATVWMLVAGVLTAVRELPLGLMVIGLFLIPNIVGTLLWRTRALSCYASTQWVIGISGICGLLTVYALDRGRLWEQIQSGGAVSALHSYVIIGMVFVVLMIVFYLRFGRESADPAA